MIELLYGVNHSGRARDASGDFYVDVVVEPPPELVGYLHSLPSGTTVGVEYHPDIYDPSLNASGRPDKYTQDYWENILGIIVESGLEPVFLEDPDMYQRYLKKRLQSVEVTSLPKEVDDQTIRQVEEGRYRAEVEARHILWIEREEAMVAAIAMVQPAAVLMGRGHTEYLMANKDSALVPKGITVGEYKADKKITVTMPLSVIDRVDVYHRTAETETVVVANPDLFPEREMLRRQYNAVTYGRINPDGNPQFVGTWDVWCRQNGLFEMYTDGKDGFDGEIEDIYGTAGFSGEESVDIVDFTKTYRRALSPDTERHPLSYQAESQDGRWYAGRYRYQDGIRKSFHLSRGDEFDFTK